MGFFDNIGKAISDVSNSTIQRGKDAVNISKYNRMISDEEKEISRVCEKLGKLYYESHTDDFEPGFAQLIDDINSSRARIKEYQEILDDLQGIIKCKSCGSNVPKGACYCPECGCKVEIEIPEETVERDPDKLYCIECGAELAPGTKFCTQCGTKVEILETIIPEEASKVTEAAEAPETCDVSEAAEDTEAAEVPEQPADTAPAAENAADTVE